VRLTILPHSCDDCLEIWEPLFTRTLKACAGVALPLILLGIDSSHFLICRTERVRI